jgi:hypothetical protein
VYCVLVFVFVCLCVCVFVCCKLNESVVCEVVIYVSVVYELYKPSYLLCGCGVVVLYCVVCCVLCCVLYCVYCVLCVVLCCVLCV